MYWNYLDIGRQVLSSWCFCSFAAFQQRRTGARVSGMKRVKMKEVPTKMHRTQFHAPAIPLTQGGSELKSWTRGWLVGLATRLLSFFLTYQIFSAKGLRHCLQPFAIMMAQMWFFFFESQIFGLHQIWTLLLYPNHLFCTDAVISHPFLPLVTAVQSLLLGIELMGFRSFWSGGKGL